MVTQTVAGWEQSIHIAFHLAKTKQTVPLGIFMKNDNPLSEGGRVIVDHQNSSSSFSTTYHVSDQVHVVRNAPNPITLRHMKSFGVSRGQNWFAVESIEGS